VSGNNVRQELILKFAQALQIEPAALEREVIAYSADFSAYGNEVYERLETRVAHWINFQEQNWFQRRLDRAFEAMRTADVVLDLGFSVPYAYTFQHLRDSATLRCVFVDKCASAARFVDIVARLHGWERGTLDQVVIADLETHGCDDVFLAVAELKPRSLVVVASEVLEHLQNDDPTWNLVRRVQHLESVTTTKFFVTLPVGRRIPSHFKEFLRSDDAVEYLRARMAIEHQYLIAPPTDSERSPFLEACLCAEGTT
jgi:hypothetical protein